MLKIDSARIGERTGPVTQLVERGAVRKFARALGMDNPQYLSWEAARDRGYRDIVAPPTYIVTLLPWELPGVTLPSAGVLHGEQDIEWEGEICAGDAISVTGWVDDVKSRRGRQGTMTFITIASEGVNQEQVTVFRARAVLIVTEEPGEETPA